MKRIKPEWMIHYIANGQPCECCGKVEYPFVDYICDAHTNGLTRLYGHPELRVILDIGTEDICSVLNYMGSQVRKGVCFSPGDQVSGVFSDCDIRIADINEGEGTEHALRVIIPDMDNRFPDDPECSLPYSLQTLPLEELRRNRKKVRH
ncbi:MAG: DUF4262 domain-containing protein [Clostridiales bacterium]|nr:DUF4262 domain-containing protein [Clostridiales bacterium]